MDLEQLKKEHRENKKPKSIEKQIQEGLGLKVPLNEPENKLNKKEENEKYDN